MGSASGPRHVGRDVRLSWRQQNHRGLSKKVGWWSSELDDMF